MFFYDTEATEIYTIEGSELIVFFGGRRSVYTRVGN